MFKKLDLYIIKKFLTTFFFILGTIMLIAVIFDVSEKIDDFLKRDAPFLKIITDYYFNFVLYFGNLFSPLLIFISVIFFTSRMASNSEIVVILSAGISFRRMVVPYMIAASFLGLISFYLNNWSIPKANKVRLDFEEAYFKNPYKNYNRNIHKQIKPNEFFYMESFNSDRNMAYKASYEKWENGKLIRKIISDFAFWDSTTNAWTFQNYQIRDFENGKQKLQKGIKMDTIIEFTATELTTRVFNSIQMMNYQELNAFIEEEKLKGSEDIPYYEIEQYQRTSLPFATYILTLIGVAISSRKVRGGIGVHLALGLLLVVSYILFMKISTVYATNAGINSLVATWFPNIIFGFIALYLFSRAHK